MANLSKYYYLFYQYLTLHNKIYDEHVFNQRFPVFVDNYEYIKKMNSMSNNSMTLGLNRFADLTQEEFAMHYLGANLSDPTTTKCAPWKPSGSPVPDSLDWRDKNIISDVKDQGQCGSCWAFAATEVLESVYALKSGDTPPPVLAPQELVDCETTSVGCSGGYPDHALAYVVDHGLELEKDYPYTARDGVCKSKDTAYRASACFDVPPNDEKALQEAVTIAPVVVLIEADQRSFQLYSSGIIPAKSCGQNIDHAVQLVGYGEQNGQPYWLLRNSWGSSWGEDGFVRLERGAGVRGGTCGILSGPSGLVV